MLKKRDMGQYYHPIIVTTKEKMEFNPHLYGEGLKITEHSSFSTPMVGLVMQYIHDRKKDSPRLVWMGDYGEVMRFGNGKSWQEARWTSNPPEVPDIKKIEPYRYIINLDKDEFADLVKCRERGDTHPLPILTANGNGKGGGDYSGTHMELVGSWAGDHISVSDDRNDIAGKKEIEAYFNEDE